MTALNKNKLKELKKIPEKGLPQFSPRINVEKVADTARELSKILADNKELDRKK